MIPRRHLPSLTALHALDALDRLGTTAAAAQELSLTQGAISKQLQSLEEALGAPVLIRQGRQLRLTPGGQDFVSEARKALKILSDASLNLRANPRGGTLNLAILPAFGMHWLAPRLANFARAHPEVTVNLSTRLRPFDFAATGFDAAIHYGRKDWPGVSYLKLMEEQVLAVGAPSLLQKPIHSALEIMDLPLLQLDSRSGDWARWLSHHNHPNIRPPAMLFDQFSTMAQAAIHGMGLALMPVFLIEEDLAAGRLLPAFGGPVPALGAYYLTWPEGRPLRAPLASFRDWLGASQDLAPHDPPQSAP
ncbi:LysR substrate-binding domain-containing protein [Xinfangfangia sp. CPCC 101601]|uniref:LysR substrate-binding domain-containing protein n=1 Tax=Pseudogemmobacter lacusdianii TaxID=3069608 RepID=A0ABU0W3P1_9RHOB|nr:LysR substrate-binding domain-containing protein [Xinfangfangia sp. CPCC 101601]MDQ2068080.1 LysR substrate-binding domain-containing protein [Xinfangfangia sp. CPCC 101601]